MTPKEKAIELVEKYKAYVHGYEYPEQILSQAKKVSVITIDEIVLAFITKLFIKK
jgi:hypothetical protein